MEMRDALETAAALNLFGGLAVILVLLLRATARRLFGARIAYALWIAVPLTAVAALLPARVVTLAVPMVPATAAVRAEGAAIASVALAPPSGPDPWVAAAALWLAGAAASLAWLAWRQARFARAARAGRAGPAVVGVLRPRVITPRDFADRFSPREQAVVLAHEQAHIARHDCRTNAAVALARCLFWFNPLMHVLARCLRVDQELACDAQVIAAHPSARRTYAEAMLKTQLAAQPLPLGCYWPPQAVHPLAARVRLLGRPLPGPVRRQAGRAAVAVLALAAAGAAWTARPPHVVAVPAAAPAVRVATTQAAEPQVPSRPARHTARHRAEASTPVSLEIAAPIPVTLAAAQPEPAAGPAPIPMPAAAARTRRITDAAGRSSVEPGSAVRVVATTVNAEGVPFWIDLTSFGSQSEYRTGGYGWFDRGPRLTTQISHGKGHGLFTSVQQHGDRLLVTASLDRRFAPATSGSVELRSGETGQLTLGNGQRVTVTPTLRPETDAERAEGEAELQRLAAGVAPRSRDIRTD